MNKDIENILKEVGKTLKKHSGNPGTVDFKSDNPADAVTDLDVWAEREIIDGLKHVTPLVPVFGEETGNGQTSEEFWTLDPIDGTGYFVRGIPFCMTMLARVKNKTVQESYLYNFSTDEFFEAHKGKGALKNNTPLHIQPSQTKTGYIEVEAQIADGTFSRIVENLHAHKHVSEKIITAGFIYGLIAEGKIEAYIAYKPYGRLYDYTAGSLLVQEAGGAVRNIGTSADTPYDVFNLNFVAGNKNVVDTLLAENGPLNFLA